jgi:hypothetical protein
MKRYCYLLTGAQSGTTRYAGTPSVYSYLMQ